MTHDDLIWLAGYLEGEGSFGTYKSGAVLMQDLMRHLEMILPSGTVVSYEREFVTGDIHVRTNTGRLWILPVEFLEDGAISQADWFCIDQSPKPLESIDEMIAMRSLNWHAKTGLK